MTLLLIVGTVVYCGLLLWLRYWWTRTDATEAAVADTEVPSPRVAVIIPVRNEALCIEALLYDLNQQTYADFEVAVIDDASEDDTAARVAAFVGRARFPLQLISLPPDDTTVAHKKRAIAAGIAATSGEVIVTTDGDCRVGPGWLASLVRAYRARRPALVSAPVTFLPTAELFGQIQILEFAGLVGAGGATMQAGHPTTCNGANLLYTRAAFERAEGFAGADHIASGDDELLMHKLVGTYGMTTHFYRHPDAVVRTSAHARWRDFFRQRRRWVSKWQGYDNVWSFALSLGYFGFHLLLTLGGVLVALGWVPLVAYAGCLSVRALIEAYYLRRVMRDLGPQWSTWAFVGLQVLYSPYIVFVGLLSTGPRAYIWKGRQVH
ncbi:MAG: glycosyltransferase [Catalinimonas sp.]